MFTSNGFSKLLIISKQTALKSYSLQVGIRQRKFLLRTFADKRLLVNNPTILPYSISNLHRHQLNKPSQVLDHPIGFHPQFCESTCWYLYESVSDTIIPSLRDPLTLCLGASLVISQCESSRQLLSFCAQCAYYLNLSIFVCSSLFFCCTHSISEVSLLVLF